MIRADDKQIRQLEKDLQTFARKALPYATRELLNRAAFETRKRAQQNIRWNMTTRNQYTEQSVRVEKAGGSDIGSMASRTGSVADYLYRQEFGGVARGKGGAAKTIATPYSSGEPEGAQPRTRLPRKPNQMQAIQLKRYGAGAKNRKQRNLLAFKEAAAEGSKFVYMDLGRRRGIFRILGGKRNGRVRMVWDLTRRAVRTPKNPWLGPATDDTRQDMPGWYEQALRYQLQRLGVLGY